MLDSLSPWSPGDADNVAFELQTYRGTNILALRRRRLSLFVQNGAFDKAEPWESWGGDGDLCQPGTLISLGGRRLYFT